MNMPWLKIALLATMTTMAAGAQTRESLFDGKTLTGWHTQGPGTWTVTDGRIHAVNPQMQWGHLVTDRIYKDGYVRMRFLNKAGNSGLYVRGMESGIYGVKGMQVDLGAPHKDGSVMRVTDSTFTWFAEITKALDSGYLKTEDWNELAVDVQGANLKTYINGKLIWSGTNLAGIATAGVLALQLHSGDNNDIYFKDVEILTPTRVPYCPTPGDPAHKPGNDPDSSLCKPVGIRVIGKPLDPSNRFPGPGWTMARSGRAVVGFRSVADPDRDIHFNLRGMRVPVFPSQTIKAIRGGGDK